VRVQPSGDVNENDEYVAQCTGPFPDFLDRRLKTGDRRFKLRQDYPLTLPRQIEQPWRQLDFKDPNQAVSYMLTLRRYAYEGMIEADWRAEDNSVRQWYHAPWMAPGRHPREMLRGMTDERFSAAPELGIITGRSAQNWAVAFYNQAGAYTLGRIWRDPTNPDPRLPQFAEGTVATKLIFSDAQASDFASGDDLLQGAYSQQAHVFDIDHQHVDQSALQLKYRPPKTVKTLRLLQIDIAVRDARANETGWVFMTFAYDHRQVSKQLDRMVPVGLTWGNADKQTILNPAAPQYSLDHIYGQTIPNRHPLLIGPIDNEKSSCISCHGTAQTPAWAPTSTDKCNNIEPAQYTTAYSLRNPRQNPVLSYWFRNLSGRVPFGHFAMDCTLLVPQTPDYSFPLDYSLQVGSAFRNFVSGYSSEIYPGEYYTNPCFPEKRPDAYALQFIKTSPPVRKPGILEYDWLYQFDIDR
jgi:hypothetical protein